MAQIQHVAPGFGFSLHYRFRIPYLESWSLSTHSAVNQILWVAAYSNSWTICSASTIDTPDNLSHRNFLYAPKHTAQNNHVELAWHTSLSEREVRCILCCRSMEMRRWVTLYCQTYVQFQAVQCNIECSRRICYRSDKLSCLPQHQVSSYCFLNLFFSNRTLLSCDCEQQSCSDWWMCRWSIVLWRAL